MYVRILVSTTISISISCRLTVTRRVSLMEQELLILLEHICSPPVFSGVRVNRSLVLCVMLCRSLLVILSFSFGHCIVCPSIDGFGLPLCIFNLSLSEKWLMLLQVAYSRLPWMSSQYGRRHLWKFVSNLLLLIKSVLLTFD
jgi:hypothetical protein